MRFKIVYNTYMISLNLTTYPGSKNFLLNLPVAYKYLTLFKKFLRQVNSTHSQLSNELHITCMSR
jgi:hypothetical protein